MSQTDPLFHPHTHATATHATPTNNDNNYDNFSDDDWEEWDGTSPFWIHCAAGSLAGLVEHALVFPLDTIRTNLQVACSVCAQQQRHKMSNMNTNTNKTTSSSLLYRVNVHTNPWSAANTSSVSMWSTIRNLMSEPLSVNVGSSAAASERSTATSSSAFTSSNNNYSLTTAWIRFSRLWRGVQTMLVGCVPAHALYFSSYETVKSLTSSSHATLSSSSSYSSVTWWGASLAGAAAVTGHDVIMTPLDTIKQRLQLGHYQASATVALRSILRVEGLAGLYKSLGVTLATNVPYGMILVLTQERIKEHLHEYQRKQQVQQLLANQLSPQPLYTLQDWHVVLLASSTAGFVASALTTPLDRVKTCLQTQHHVPTCWKGPIVDHKECPKNQTARLVSSLPKHGTVWDAGRFILQQEGWMGFYRGLLPRVLSHTPAAAISWTTYETTKTYLLQAHGVF
ncbi:hypothetical protein MPSEU_000673300 [Mayamaea pseudoterrestris]|nr:hypothetical protein MPSEU_000673300 [Mayamaea pseudoterrestris]